MQNLIESESSPRYTLRWIAFHCLFAFGIGLAMVIFTDVMATEARGRVAEPELDFSLWKFVDCVDYSFWLAAISLLAVMLVEVAVRKPITYLQYGLIGAALIMFYQLLWALEEQMPFAAAYVIVALLTMALIVWFIHGITGRVRAAAVCSAVLAVEYGLIFLLISLGSAALLVGSIAMFLLIALAMYFTLKLKIENEELVIK